MRKKISEKEVSEKEVRSQRSEVSKYGGLAFLPDL
jgi:hypothetical protein